MSKEKKNYVFSELWKIQGEETASGEANETAFAEANKTASAEANEAKHVEAGSAQKSASFVYCQSTAKSCQFGLWQWKVCALSTTGINILRNRSWKDYIYFFLLTVFATKE